MAQDHKLQLAHFDAAPGPLPLQMAKSDGTALPLVKRGPFAADLIRFAPGKGVALHTHPGDHILVVVSGKGWLTFRDEMIALYEGVIYLVPGSVPHAIDAAKDAELTLLSVANDHRPADAEERMDIAPR